MPTLVCPAKCGRRGQVRALVSLVIPLREVALVERADSPGCTPDLAAALCVSLKRRQSFLFAQVADRDFVLERISEFLHRSSAHLA